MENENRSEDRIDISPLKKASLYKVDGDQKKFTVSVLDQSENGLGCFYTGDLDLKEGEIFYTQDKEKVEVRWKKQLKNNIYFFGLYKD